MKAGVYDRLKIAEAWFTGIVMEEIGCTEDNALKIMDLYLSNKLMKPDIGVNRFKMKDGRFWEKDVLLRALEMATT